MAAMRKPRGTWSPKQRRIRDTKQPVQEYKYQRKWYLVTRSELSFFHTLLGVVNNFYYVVPQVHLSSLLDHKAWGQSWKGALSRIQRKSVDYVICSRDELTPVCVVELDDPSHSAPDRIERDKLVESIFKEAGIPLIRIKTQEQNNLQLVRDKLAGVVIPSRIKPSPSSS